MYRTKSGQYWDEIAYELWGDCKYVRHLINANRQYLKYFKFPAGIELEVPEIPKEASVKLPAWYS